MNDRRDRRSLITFWVLVAAAATLELAAAVGLACTSFPSRWFSLAAQAMTVGLITALFAVVVYQRRTVDAAFDLGVEVGERRGRRQARPVVVSLDERRGELA